MRIQQPLFLPMSLQEMQALGWNELDILLISGDAYVDHPSFGTALLGRHLVAHGFRVGVIAQPRWMPQEDALADISCMGRPRLFAGVSAGAIDSMLAHYTAFRKKRSDDAYTPGGLAGKRPNRAVLVYTTLVRQAFPGLPVVTGGIEASLRRLSHYDFWSDSLRRSILLDSKADLLVCGMGENAILAAAHAAEDALADQDRFPGKNAQRDAFIAKARHIPGTASILNASQVAQLPEADAIVLPSHEDILANPALLLHASIDLERIVHQGQHAAIQASADRSVWLAPPAKPLSTDALDAVYSLPFSRLPHPSYTEAIPAWEMIRTSITSHRGCAGGCAFCSLALHQGRRIASRSRASILSEAKNIASGRPPLETENIQNNKIPAWCGAISDVGGPSANMWQASCSLDVTRCVRPSCLHPHICPGFTLNQKQGVRLLDDVAKQPGVRHVRIASGVRFDLALTEPEALAAYVGEYTGGQLKVAPEHCAEQVLRYMRKPPLSVFESFCTAFEDYAHTKHKELYVIPYLMSAYPGCTENDMRQTAEWLRKRNWRPQQVQCFIPTPGTVATAMFFAGMDPEGKSIYVARSDAERLRQHYMLLEGSDAEKRTRGNRQDTGTRRTQRPGERPERSAKPPAKHGQTRQNERSSKRGDTRNDSLNPASTPAGTTQKNETRHHDRAHTKKQRGRP